MKAPFERVVQRHGPAVLRVCTFVLGPLDAEDAWSDTFLAALRAYPDLADDANVEAWLVTIAHRKCVDIIRRREREALAIGDVPDRPTTIGVPGAADDQLTSAVRALRPSSGRRWPTTISSACRTPRSPHCWAVPPTRPARPPPTESPHCEPIIRTPCRKERTDERHPDPPAPTPRTVRDH